ncbi:uncharacterized protein E0L32_010208 [Thyridium curvatum]|uniref:CFEM domain-containing protein n=1 Tax=Thyridium curvatum TaxID=1093900 RepID=A0A507ATA1_9PEZI|nr:uncharacterized protein E0L32_010208 [Thyridium curvatum]TPX08141.1 hypothetical protein E0L32_010208 [Thyridium curvatum]
MKFSSVSIPLFLAGSAAAASGTAASTGGSSTSASAASASSTDLPSLVSQLPRCALPCLESAAQSVNCQASDFTCLCAAQSKLLAALGPCIITSSCKPAEINTAKDVAPQICNAIKGAQPSQVSAAASVVTSAMGSKSTNAAAPARTAFPVAAAVTTLAMSTQMEVLAKQIADSVESLKRDNKSPEEEAQHRAVIAKSAHALAHLTKTPIEHLMDRFVIYTEDAALALFIQWKAFDVIPEEGTISYQELASKLDADVSLISMELLSSPHDTVEGILIPMFSFPSYFEKHGRKEPASRRHTPKAFADGQDGLTVWEIVNQDPAKKARMMAAMALFESSVPVVAGYSFDWVVAAAAESPRRALVVDVGGGRGHSLVAICERTPGLDIRRCVLEDLEPVLDAVREAADGPIRDAQLVALDFHREQPIKGACAYYMSRCLHDYGDDECVGMLARLADAMAADSRVLIKEQLLDDPPAPQSAASDINMLAIGGKERNLAGFESITSRAGLKIKEVVREGTFAILECVKA